MSGVQEKYTSKIIKSGALINETRSILSYWDSDINKDKNYERIFGNNLLAKSSRTRVRNIIKTFDKRYGSYDLLNSLIVFEKNNLPSTFIEKILYYYSAREDNLLHDFVCEIIYPNYRTGVREITTQEVIPALLKWSNNSKTIEPWSEKTCLSIAQHLLATGRDFKVLSGSVRKTISPSLLPVPAFAFIAFQMKMDGLSGNQILKSNSWKLFLLDELTIERFFIEAHQDGLLNYDAAGKVIRVDFKTDNLLEYAKYVAKKEN